MANQNSKTNLLNHSEAKVRLLSEYLKRYLNIICNDGYTKRIKIYDLFCGEGLYNNGGEGSPIVILKQIKDLHTLNVAKVDSIPAIDCHFNDIDKTKIEKVQKIVQDRNLHKSEFGNIDFTTNDYQVELTNLCKSLTQPKDHKAFVFIDPYQYKHIKASQIKEIIKNKNAEVLLWLPTQFMYRFSNNGTPEVLYDFIEELTEYREWKKTDSVWKFIEQLKQGFQSFVGDNFFVDKFSIQKDTSTVFCLYFFTSHIKGFEKMLEAKWEIDTEQGKGWDYSGNEPSLFYEYKINPLEEQLSSFLRQKRTNGEVYDFTLRQAFLPKHANQIFKSWQKSGKLEVLLTDGTNARKGAFYISYEHYRDDNEKVFYKLK